MLCISVILAWFIIDFATALSSDPYTCFVDAPNSHPTTGCRKSEASCDTGQAVVVSQRTINPDYEWIWECSFYEFEGCGLVWCAPTASCISVNKCGCDSGLTGNSLTGCENVTSFYSNSNVSLGDPTPCQVVKEAEDYFIHFIVTLVVLLVVNVAQGVAHFLHVRHLNRKYGSRVAETHEMKNSNYPV